MEQQRDITPSENVIRGQPARSVTMASRWKVFDLRRSDPVGRRCARRPRLRDSSTLVVELSTEIGDMELEAQLFNGIVRGIVKK
jgi:hypothetical protein